MDWDAKFGWANVIALSTFVAGYFLRWILDIVMSRRRRRDFYRALATEVRLNVEAVEIALSQLPTAQVFQAFLEASPNNRPHTISTYMCSIYQSHLTALTSLPRVVRQNIIEFYGMLEFIQELARSFEKRSYEVISLAGRQAAVEMLRAKLAEARTKGRAVSDLIERDLGI